MAIRKSINTIKTELQSKINTAGEYWLEKMPADLGNYAGVVEVPNTENMVYARLSNGQVIEVFNNVAPNIFNWKVTVGRDKSQPWLVKVAEVRWIYNIRNTVAYVLFHHKQHEFPAPDTVWVRRDQFMPLLVLPAGGFNVAIYGDVIYVFGMTAPVRIADAIVDLSSHAITEGAKYVLLEVEANGDLNYVTGTTYDSLEILYGQPLPTPSDDAFPVCAFIFYDGQVELRRDSTERTIIDLRMFVSNNGAYSPIGHTHPSNEVIMPVVGTPANTTLTHDFTARGSSGVIDGTLTYVEVDTGDHKIKVAAGEGYLRTSNDQQGALVFCEWPAVTQIDIPAPAANQETTRFVGIEYNSGSPQVTVRTTFNWNWYTDFPLARVSYDGSELHILNAYAHAEDVANNIRRYLRLILPFQRESSPEGSGGLEISSNASQQLAMTAGNVWHGFNRYVMSAISFGATFDVHYRAAGGGFVNASATQWSNTTYDDGSGTPATLTNNKYACHWIYLDISDGTINDVLGRDQYNNVAAAQLEAVPTTPDHLTYHGRLIARLIFQKSASSASLVESAWSTLFTPSSIGNHGDLTGLQGGAAGEYYHLTAAEYAALGSGFPNPFALTADITPTALSGNVNDYDPTGLSTADVLRLEASGADRNITGLAGGAGGRIVVIYNVGSTYNLNFMNENASSAAGNRFAFRFTLVLAPNNAVALQYDDTSSRWRVLGANASTLQGAPISAALLSALTDGATLIWDAGGGYFVAGDINSALSAELVQDIVGAMFSGNTETGITVTYEDSDGTIDLVVSGTTPGKPPGGRLTLTSGSPVTTADVTGATNIYYTPAGTHNTIELWNGSAWVEVTFTELTLALGTLTAAIGYDVFGYLNAGVLALELLAWTSGTVRATGVSLQDGRYCKTGNKTRLYLGTFYTTSTTTTEDSVTKRFLFNMYNRHPRPMLRNTGATHNYNTATIRAWNNDAPNSMVEYFIGLIEDTVRIDILGQLLRAAADGAPRIRFGVNSTTTEYGIWGLAVSAITGRITGGGTTSFAPSLGYSYVVVTEFSTAGTAPGTSFEAAALSGEILG